MSKFTLTLLVSFSLLLRSVFASSGLSSISLKPGSVHYISSSDDSESDPFPFLDISSINSDSVHYLDLNETFEYSAQDSNLFDSESDIELNFDDVHLLSDHEFDFDLDSESDSQNTTGETTGTPTLEINGDFN